MQSSHADFSQAGYPQQYAYASTLSSVPSNSSHDMSKQVAAGQPGMYGNSGGMPTAAQHHQSVVGAVPPPQPGSFVQQGQQMNRANPMTMQGFYPTRTTVPRTIPNMGRNQLPTVVSQTGQQPSQYGHLQMVPASSYPHMQQMMAVNPQISMYPQRPYTAGQFVLPQQPMYQISSCYQPSFPSAPQPSSNGYFPPHGMSTYNHPIQSPIPASSIPAQPVQTKRSKALKITHPDTGEEIKLDADSADQSARPTVEKETENADPTVCIQFAKQVALTMTEIQNEPSSKLQPAEDTRVMNSQIHLQGPLEVEPPTDNSSRVVMADVDSPGELGDTESIGDIDYVGSRNLQCGDEPSVILYNEDIDTHSINDCTYENEICAQDTDSVAVSDLRDPKMYDMVVSGEYSPSDSDKPITTDSVQVQDSILTPEKPLGVYELKGVQVQSSTELDTAQVANSDVTAVKEESKVPDNSSGWLEGSAPDASFAKSSDKSTSESKRNKTKKKKDFNKKGESKEGGEMDAFLDVKQEDAPAPVLPSAPPVPVVERMPSPVPILDSEILSTIPLPGESFDNFPQQNDVSPTSETSSVSPSAESEDKENISDETPKIVLKYSYKEDQWSPLNPEGKKQYDRNFLLQLQGQPMSLCKPTNLPNLDVIKDKAHIQRLTEVNRAPPPMIPTIRTPFMQNDPFMPNYARGGPPRLPHPAVNRRSQQGRGEKPRKVISFTSSLTQNIKLHESENAWKPLAKLEQTQEIGGDNLEKEKLKRSVQGVLNKLTPQKFETLLTQLKNLNIDTEEKLTVVIDLIFEKAIDEPNFSVPYANLCKHLALVKVPVKPELLQQGGSQNVNFRKLLLTKCQKEFEQDSREELKNEERMKDIEAAEPDKKKELQMEFDADEKKLRYRQLGNIRFIGELFKLNMLIEPIMHDCIRKLLTSNDDESLECLCKLLKTIGKELDEKGSKSSRGDNPSMDMYFGQMQKIVDQKLTSSRVRFMLQDVIDFKKNNWVPRRDENNPKTIDQIHKEAELEAREQQQNLQNMSNYPKRVPEERERRKTPGRNIAQSEDGWTASSKSNKGSYSSLDPSKLKLTKPDELETIRLGPGGRGLSSWGRGSSGGTKAPDTAAAPLANRWSALAETNLPAPNYEGRRGSQRSAASSRESSRGRSNQPPTTVRKTPSTSKERENLLETVKGLARATESKVPDTIQKTADVHVNGKAAEPDELSLRGPSYSEEEMEKKTKPLVDEFLHNNDFDEAIKCVMELASPNTIHFFIITAINQVLERSSQTRYSLGQLFFSLLRKNIITFEQYKKGTSAVLEIIDDYALDIPLIWDYMGEILEPLIEDTEFPFTRLKEALQPCIPSETAGMLVSSILHATAKRKGTIKLGEVWRESGLQWADFLGNEINVNDFIEKHKLEFTISPIKVKPNTQLSIEEIKTNLLSMLEKNSGTEEIFDWIDANVPNTEPNFIRALVAAVHESAISGSDARCKLDTTKLKERAPLLTRYIQHNENLELQALYAIQSLMNDLGQPNGVLHQIFDILYDEDIITEDTFKVWESSDDPNEAEGKGVAVHSVKSFFTWLRESESADEAEE